MNLVSVLGDSLTAGHLGVPYLPLVTPPPNTRLLNRGINGQTLAAVSARLSQTLEHDTPAAIVLEAGANDLLLPAVAARGPAWESFAEEMARPGNRSAEGADDFRDIYVNFLETARTALGDGRVICVTITPLGEDLGSELNLRRRRINTVIRSCAARFGCPLANPAAAFESVLADNPLPSDWLFQGPNHFALDARRIRRDKSAAPLSEERGLRLTMDGAHLNEKGAALMAREITAALETLS